MSDSFGGVKLKVGLDGTAIEGDIQKISNNVGKSTTGMAKGIASAMGQSLGPFGELIEKADALKSAFGSISTGSKLMAGAVGIAGVAAVYSVKKAIEAYKEMREAQEDATESAERLAKAQENIGKTIKGGIAEGQKARAVSNVEGQIADLEGANREKVTFTGQGGTQTYNKLSPSEIKANEAKIAELRKLITEENLRKSIAKGEARLGEAALTPEARRAMGEATFQKTVGSIGTAELPNYRAQRAAVGEELANLATLPKTQANSAQANAATEFANQLDRLIKALEEKAKAEEEFTKSYLEAGEVKEDATAKTDSPSKQVPTGYTMPSGYGVGGYTSTGGGGNIYGNTAGMSAKIQSMADNVKKIAENTTPRTEDSEPFITR